MLRCQAIENGLKPVQTHKIVLKIILYDVNDIKDFSKERYNTYTKSCNSILYTKMNSVYIYIEQS